MKKTILNTTLDVETTNADAREALEKALYILKSSGDIEEYYSPDCAPSMVKAIEKYQRALSIVEDYVQLSLMNIGINSDLIEQVLKGMQGA